MAWDPCVPSPTASRRQSLQTVPASVLKHCFVKVLTELVDDQTMMSTPVSTTDCLWISTIVWHHLHGRAGSDSCHACCLTSVLTASDWWGDLSLQFRREVARTLS